jgi:hypothetical protein
MAMQPRRFPLPCTPRRLMATASDGSIPATFPAGVTRPNMASSAYLAYTTIVRWTRHRFAGWPQRICHPCPVIIRVRPPGTGCPASCPPDLAEPDSPVDQPKPNALAQGSVNVPGPFLRPDAPNPPALRPRPPPGRAVNASTPQRAADSCCLTDAALHLDGHRSAALGITTASDSVGHVQFGIPFLRRTVSSPTRCPRSRYSYSQGVHRDFADIQP